MTDRQFLIRMIALAEKLSDVTNLHGYRSPPYRAVLDEISQLGESINRSRRRHSWGCIVALFVLSCICVYLLIVWLIRLLEAYLSIL